MGSVFSRLLGFSCFLTLSAYTSAFAQDNSVSAESIATPLAADVGQTLVLDPTDGFDLTRNGIVTPRWSWITRPDISVADFSDPSLLRPTFTVDVAGRYVAQLELFAEGVEASVATAYVEISTENTAPVARITPRATADMADGIWLDGSASYDVEGDALTYQWSVIPVSGDGTARIDAPDAPLTAVSVQSDGIYEFRLDVQDSNGAFARTQTLRVMIDTDQPNGRAIAPVADLGFDQITISVGDALSLDALGSSDVDGDLLSADITLITAPDLSSALTQDEDARMSLTASIAGDYLVSARVTDGGFEGYDQLLVTTGNARPVAKIAPVTLAEIGIEITVDGSQSYDLNGDALQYQWSVLHAPTDVALNNANTPGPSFIPDATGVYVLQLSVSDGITSSVPQTVLISTSLSTPFANADAYDLPTDFVDDLSAFGNEVEHWALVQTLESNTVSSLRAMQLTVAGEDLVSLPDTAIIGAGNLAPAAAPVDMDTIVSGETVRLMSSAIDPNGDAVNTHWSLLSKPDQSALSIAIADQSAPLLDITPDVPGEYLVQLAADDGTLLAEPVVYRLSVINSAPQAGIAAINDHFVGDGIALDGRSSFDRDGDPLRYEWAVVAAPDTSVAKIVDAGQVLASFAPDQQGDYQLRLTVSDHLQSASEVVSFTVLNQAPEALLDGPSLSIAGESVTFTGTGSTDPDGDALTYAFEIIDPDGQIMGAVTDGADMTFAPEPLGTYQVALTVTDGTATAQTSMGLVVEGLNNSPQLDPIQENYTVEMGLELALDIGASDADGDTITYFASPLPTGTTLDAQTGALRFRPAVGQIGEYGIVIGASDGRDTSETAMTVSVVAGSADDTGLHGRVVDASEINRGLSNVPVRLENAGLQTLTDATGAFSFGSLKAGADTIIVNADDVSADADFMSQSRSVQIVLNQNIDVAPTIYLVPLNDGCQAVVAGRDTVLTGASGLKVSVPANTIRAVGGGLYEGDLCLGVLPQNFDHPALPVTVDACHIYGVQAPGAVFSSGFEVTAPNVDGLPEGARLHVYQMAMNGTGFGIAGEAVVQPGGSGVSTTLYGETLFSFVPQAPTVVQSQVMPYGNWIPDAATGDLLHNYALPTYLSSNTVQELGLRYLASGANPVSIISGDVTISDMAALPLSLDTFLDLGGVQIDGGTQWNPRTGRNGQKPKQIGEAVSLRQAMSVDMSGMASGRHPYIFTTQANYACSSVSAQYDGAVLVHNDMDSPFGRGWSMTGMPRLYQTATGDVAIIEDDRIATFAPKQAITSFEDAPITVPVAGAIGIDSGDFDGNGTIDVAVLLSDGSARVVSNNGGRDFEVLTDNSDTQLSDTSVNPKAMQAIGGYGYLDKDGSPLANSLSTGTAPFDLLVADINDDGKTDVVFGRDNTLPSGIDLGIDGGQFHYIGRGDGTLNMFHSDASAYPYSALDLADIDGDGSVDLISVSDGAVRIRFSSTQGLGLFDAGAGEFSRLTRLADGSWSRVANDGTTTNFDNNGRVTTQVTATGQLRRFSYDANDQLISLADTAGRETTFAYAGDHISTITTPDGRQTQLSHNGATGTLTEIVDPTDARVTYQYDTDGHMIAATNADGYTTRYRYDEFGRLGQTRFADGSTTKVAAAATDGLSGTGILPFLDAGDYRSVLTDQAGHMSHVSLNAFGSVVLVEDSTGRQTTTTRDADNLAISVTSPSSVIAGGARVDVFEYDGSGRFVNETQAHRTDAQRSRSWRYDEKGYLVSHSDWDGLQTVYEYDDAGHLMRVSDGLGDIAVYSRTPQGLIAEEVDANGNTTAYDHDDALNTVRITNAAGSVTEITRDGAGNPIGTREAVGKDVSRLTTQLFDGQNRLGQEIIAGADGQIVASRSISYSPSGLPVSKTRLDGVTRDWSYDGLGRILSDGTAALVYDPRGLALSKASARGAMTTFDYDAAGRLIGETNGRGQRTTYEYDLRDNVVRVRVNGAIREQVVFDVLDRQIARTDALGRQTSWSLDGAGRVVKQIAADGTVQTTRHDARGRPVAVATDDNQIRYTYDLMNNLTSAADKDSKLSMTYDALNLLQSVTTDGFVGPQPAATLTYDRDALGRIATNTDSMGGVTQHSYNAADQMVRQIAPWGTTYNWTFDDAGRPVALMASTERSAALTYDANQLDRMMHSQSGVVLADWTFAFDQYGAISAISDAVNPDLSKHFMRDAQGAIIQVTQGAQAIPVQDYAYDGSGALIASHDSTAYVYDAAGQLMSDDKYSYAYDARGNMVSRSRKDDDFAESYSYDVQNRLVGYASPDQSIGYAYDALGHLIARTEVGTETSYIPDLTCPGGCVALTFDSETAPKLSQRWIHDATGTPLSFETYAKGPIAGTGSAHEMLFDNAGQNLLVIDPTSGNEVASVQYDSNGVLLSHQGLEGALLSHLLDLSAGLRFSSQAVYDLDNGRSLQAVQ